ncbi:MAG: polysaccharide deacetylase family protein [Clostridia bacterium]|nr:polysaccharide deacetylase family protein [Clostridia bacterium]
MKKIIAVFLTVCCLMMGVYAESGDAKRVPVLMYHSVSNGQNDVTISPENFRKHLEVMQDNGFTPISVSDMIEFVDNGKELPGKPVCITFDDGYSDNFSNAFPLLEEFGFKATIFIIGSSVGKDTYKDTGFGINAHFDFGQAKEMYESGLVSIQSHSFDMHQWEGGENSLSVRKNVLPFDGENIFDYVNAFQNDFKKSKADIEENVGNEVVAFAYPTGRYNALSEFILKQNGVRVTMATSEGPNYIKKGDKESLYKLNRYNVGDQISEEHLLKWLNEGSL